jgi:hypothetical protein
MPSASKAREVRRRATKRPELQIGANSINSACERFFRSRGMPITQRENRGHTTEEPKTDGMEI